MDVMIWGLSLTQFTLFHVLVSIIAIVTGLIVLGGMYAAQKLPVWTAIFLLTTVVTSITGFFFPNTKVTPGQVFGGLTLLVMVPTVVGLYVLRLRGAWRWIYTAGAIVVLYLNVFVLIAQLFAKVTALQALAPTQSEPPFLLTEAVVLAVFAILGLIALFTFHPERKTA
jgi:hypothetical protein